MRARCTLLALLALAACSYDLDSIPRKSGTASDGGGSDAGDGGGGDRNHDAGHDASMPITPHDSGAPVKPHPDAGGSVDSSTPQPDAMAPVCMADEQRCHGALLETCRSDGTAWKKSTDCGDKSCNPATLECYACAAALDNDGVLSCVAARADDKGSAIAEIDTTDGSTTETGSCGGAGSPERIVEWTAPATDYWVLDTRGSSFDTVLYARDCACDGSEIACNNNADGTTSDSELTARFEKGQRVAVVIDGNAGDKGGAVLNAHAVTCPSFDLQLAALPSSFADKNTDGSEAFRFTPSATAFYSIRVESASNKAKVCLIDGPRCGGPVISCNTAGNVYGAEVIREIAKDRVVTIEVTLGTGDTSFDLDVQPVPGAVCETPLPSGPPLVVDDASGNDLTSSCAVPAAINLDNHPVPTNETSFVVGYPGNGAGCGVAIDADFLPVVYLLESDCSSAEVSCVVGTYNSTSGKYEASLGLPNGPDQHDYLLVVEDLNPQFQSSNTFEWQEQCIL